MWDSEKQNIFFKVISLNGHGSGSVLTNPSFHPLAHEHKIKIFMVVCHPPFCPPCHSLSLLYLFLFLYLVLHSLCPNLVSPIWSILSGLENLMLALPSDSQLPVLPQIGPLLNFNLVEANHDLALGAIFSSSPGFLPLPICFSEIDHTEAFQPTNDIFPSLPHRFWLSSWLVISSVELWCKGAVSRAFLREK